MNRFITICLIIVFSTISKAQLPYQDKALSPEKRAEDLIRHLTLEEKVSLMMNASEAIPRLGVKQYEWWNEALHGVARNGTATVFPQAIGMAASFDDSLLYNVFSAISDEARVKNRQARENGAPKRYQGLTMWTPNINIFRDPRWGRGQETYGEDPYLTSVMGVSVIKGLQGKSNGKYDKLHACAKHYAVHSGPEWNRHSFNAENISQRDLWETYLPAFKAAVQKGNVKEVMCAYNRFEGEPCCGSNRLLTEILREQWGYNGIIVSDCGAIDDFYKPNKHLTHQDSKGASASAILSGTDLECGSSYKSISAAVQQGLIREDEINISLKRLLKARFELGEMDDNTPWDKLPDSLISCREHQALALKMAQKSIVLLQNNGILPLNRKSKIALLGPNANDSVMQWGNYNGFPKHTYTLFEALRQQLTGSEVIYDATCELTDKKVSLFNECSEKGKLGFSAVYWNNTEMKGNPVAETQIISALKIGKKDTFARGVNLNNISGKFHTTFRPTETGPAEILFNTSNKIKLFIDGREIKLDFITNSLQISILEATAGNKYDIVIEFIRDEEPGGLRFNIQRTVKIDISKTIQLVKDVDVVIFAGGISANLEREDASVYATGFKGGDRTNIELPQVQRSLISELKAAGKNVVFVNFSGSAMGLVPESINCDAILQAWYPGEAGGKAIFDVLYGNYNPAGRLPITFYRNIEQLPDFENYDMKGRTYRYMKDTPLFAFGYGLSYTSFKYSNISLDKQQLKAGESATLTVSVTNTGKYNGEEVVQVYLKKNNDINGPEKTLRAFKRIAINAGQTINVVFELTGESFEWWNNTTNNISVNPGDYQLMVGGSSRNEDLTKLDFHIF
jgi:beta-glucosidase